MFGRKKNGGTNAEDVGASSVEVGPKKGYTPGKGTRTRSRKEAEAANRHPIVADKRRMSKEELRAHKAEQRARSNESWQRQQEAMRTGDTNNMPLSHRGPVRAFGRNVVDSRFNLGAYFMPLAFVLVLSIFFQARFPAVFMTTTLAGYAVFIIMAIDTGLTVRRARILAEHKFGSERMPRGFALQMFSRAMYIRRWRMPRPQVGLGEYPAGASSEDYRQAKEALREQARSQRAARRASRRAK
ncbi:MAG: DUF3043 domain-containing protein [Actinomycetaceae bacterium]|nr:DUF3043 domain-containing protein [Actinomycetaceae bacterium]